MRKIISILLLVLLSFSVVACGKTDDSGSSQKPGDSSGITERTEITIPTVTVDLFDPENKVEVSETDKSTVTDSNGRTLTEKEWLLNSKFSKKYIASIGVGEYTFDYSSEKAYGKITLIVTDNQAPNYVLSFELGETVYYDELSLLPKVVKNPDSYQANSEVEYALSAENGDTQESVAYTEHDEKSFISDLKPGSYVWKATVKSGEKTVTYERTFEKESYSSYYARVMPTMIYDKFRNEYCPFDGEYITVDTTVLGNSDSDQMNFSITNEEALKQIALGNTAVKFTIISENGDTNGVRENGNADTGLFVTIGSVYRNVYYKDQTTLVRSDFVLKKEAYGEKGFKYEITVKIDGKMFTDSQEILLKATYGCKRVYKVIPEFVKWEDVA